MLIESDSFFLKHEKNLSSGKTNIAMGNPPFFHRRYIFKWWISQPAMLVYQRVGDIDHLAGLAPRTPRLEGHPIGTGQPVGRFSSEFLDVESQRSKKTTTKTFVKAVF